MYKDPTQFRKRFAAWKAGKTVYKDGLPSYQDGKDEWQEYEDYAIPFINSKRVRLTNAGRATGAVLSTNMLDSIADNAVRAGLPVRTAIGLATKESTLGNPTDDRSGWNLSSEIRKQFNNVYPGTALHINRGAAISERELINFYKDQEDSRYGQRGKSVLQGGFEFYRQNPNRYNPGQKDYSKLVDKRANEVMQSPEVQSWLLLRVARQNKQFFRNKNRHWVRPKFHDGTEPNLFQRPDGTYFYDDGNYETTVTPLNKLGDDPAMWTFQDSSGKIYQPRILQQPTLFLSEDPDRYTKDQINNTNLRTWLSDAADFSHTLGEAAMNASMFINAPVYGTYNLIKQGVLNNFGRVAQLTRPIINNNIVGNTVFENAVRNVSGKEINDAINKGFTSQFGTRFDQFPQEVENAYKNQIIPRRLHVLLQTQQTRGVLKIDLFVKEYGSVNFSTPEGMKIAKDNGWTFDEILDYTAYKDYEELLNKTLNGGYVQYPKTAWNLRHPAEAGYEVTGAYNPETDTVELPEGFSVTGAIHEPRHRMLRIAPSIQMEKNILHNAYDYNLRDSEFGTKIYNKELETTNAELRKRLLSENGAENMSLKTQNTLLQSDVYYSDDHILYELENTNAYGEHIVNNIKVRLEQIKKSIENSGLKLGTKEFDDEINLIKHQIVSNIRYALQAVGAYSGATTLTNTQNELRNK